MSIFLNKSNDKSLSACPHPTNPAFFCTYKSCNKPLCSSCIASHTHPTNNQYIIAIEEAEKVSLEKTDKFIDSLKYEIEKVNVHITELEFEKNKNEDLLLINRNRQNIKKLVKKFFETLEKECDKLLYSSFDLRITQLNAIQSELHQIYQKLNEIQTGLSSKNQAKKASLIENCYNFNVKNELLRLSNEFKEVLQKQNLKKFEKLPEITTNIEFILKNVFHESLNLLLDTEKTPKNASKNANDHKKQTTLEINEKLVETSTISSNFSVTMGDFFEKNCQHKCLSFINPEKHALYFTKLDSSPTESPSKQQKLKFDKIQIAAPDELPYRHRSFILPDGSLYLLGGCYKSSGLITNETLRFNWESKSFLPKNNMLDFRKSFGLCYSENFLYVIGGFNYDEGFLAKCEKYDISKDKWSKIAGLLRPLSSPAVSTYKKKYLYIFGGLQGVKSVSKSFQRYDIDNDQWILFDIAEKNQLHGLKFLWLSTGIQINEHEIMFFGGLDSENQPSEQTFIMKIINEQLFRVTNVGTRNLKEKGGFWNTQTVVFNHSVFGLQNILLEKNKDCADEGKRNFIFFSDFQWKNL